MTTPTDYYPRVRELAELLISRQGERAATYAIHQSFKAGNRGDQRAMEAWLWIGDTVAEIWRVEPTEGRHAVPRPKKASRDVRTAGIPPLVTVMVGLGLVSYVAVVGIYVMGVSEGWWR